MTRKRDILFKLTATLPDNLIESYKGKDLVSTKLGSASGLRGFYLVFHDTQDAGFDAVDEGSIFVKLLSPADADGNRTEVRTLVKDSDYTIKTKTPENGLDCSFEIVLESIEEYAQPGGQIEVKYTSKLNAGAVTGTAGNNNKIRLESPEPDEPEDNVKVFNLELIVNKVDGNDQPLNGAGFTLYEADGTTVVAELTAEPVTEGEGETAVTKNGPRFTLKNLKPGTYVLKETKKPGPEYTDLKDITITVTAEVEEVSGKEAANLHVGVTGGNFTVVDDVIALKDNRNLKGNIISTIENLTGIQLPETGGIGTTIFYILGGILVVGAAVLLITKRRMNASEE